MTAFTDMAEDIMSDEDMTDSATFTPAVGEAETVRVNLVLALKEQPSNLDAQVWGSETTIEYSLADIGREVDEDETFTISDTVYTVTHILENDGIFVKAAVK